MKASAVFAPGGYRYLPAVMQYSAGVAAEPGHVIERARFTRPLPLAGGFAAIEAFLRSRDRAPTALCACELRSPEPFTEAGFAQFNRHYVQTLEGWGIYRDGVNPVARTNVCPAFGPPREPSLFAFSYTMPTTSKMAGTFVVAGSGETREGGASYRESIVRCGDTSLAGMRDKVRHVVAAMKQRCAALGFTTGDATATHAYTVRDIGPLLHDELFGQGIGADGLTLHACLPPVVGLEFEMDLRATATETVIGARGG